MKSLFHFIKDFKGRSGFHLFSSGIFEKLANFLISWILILVLDKTTLGTLTYAQSVLIFFFMLSGFGSHQSLLLMGAQLKSTTDKFNLLSYTLSRGLQANLILMGIAVIFSFFLSENNSSLFIMFVLLTVQIIPLYLSRVQSIWYRFSLKNKELFRYEWVKTLMQLFLSLGLIALFKVYGYLVALIITPLLVLLLLPIRFPIRWNTKWKLKQFSEAYYWKYSVFSTLATLVSQVIFVVDAIIIHQMLSEEANAEYRVASIIPFNLLFIPLIFLKTDYATITQNKNNKEFLKTYYTRFFLLFIIITTAIFIFGYFAGPYFLPLFGKQYQPYEMFLVLLLASCVSMLLRVPLGNMIAALGKADFNFYNALITIILDVVLNYFFILNYGLIGAAYATAISLIVSGILSFFYFLWYLDQLE